MLQIITFMSFTILFVRVNAFDVVKIVYNNNSMGYMVLTNNKSICTNTALAGGTKYVLGDLIIDSNGGFVYNNGEIYFSLTDNYTLTIPSTFNAMVYAETEMDLIKIYNNGNINSNMGLLPDMNSNVVCCEGEICETYSILDPEITTTTTTTTTTNAPTTTLPNGTVTFDEYFEWLVNTNIVFYLDNDGTLVYKYTHCVGNCNIDMNGGFKYAKHGSTLSVENI